MGDIKIPDEWWAEPIKLAAPEPAPPTDEEEVERISKRYSS